MEADEVRKRVLIACCADPRNDPRPFRMIQWLKDPYDVTVASYVPQGRVEIDGVRCFTMNEPPPPPVTFWSKVRNKTLTVFRVRGMLKLARIRLGMFEPLVWPLLQQYYPILDLLREDFDLIISHDLVLMPLIFRANRNAKVLLDAREFYPRNYDDQFKWRLMTGPINDYLCREYMPRCDKMVTVCDGLAAEYNRCYGVAPEVLMSLPGYRELPVRPVEDGVVRMIHHGHASPSRRIETMIEMMDHVDERFRLDLMLMPNQSEYWRMLCGMVEQRKNVRMIPPVTMPEIIPFSNAYDVGLFLCQPSNFNLKFALPNKLFEFIQSRLMVAIGPSVEMRKIVERYGCGVVAEDFEPATLGRVLNALSAEQIARYKEQSGRAAGELNEGANRARVLEMVGGLIGGEA